MPKVEIPLRITIEVNDTDESASLLGTLGWETEPYSAARRQSSSEITVREVPGGVVLDVPEKARKRLLEFGWTPPVGDV